MNQKKQEIQFPCRWEFRLVASGETLPLTRNAVEMIGKQENAGFEITDGGVSKSGKYSTIRIACEVDSLARARGLAEMLSRVEGVRFLI